MISAFQYGQEIRRALKRVAKLLWAWAPWLSVAVLTAALGALLLWGPEQMVQWVGVRPHESYAGMVNEYRRTLTQALTVLGGVLALYLLWRRTKSAEETLRIGKDTLLATKDSKITERFAKAVEQLGALDKDGKKPILEMRFGGIYALERIARESAHDHQPIMEIPTAYVRQNAPWHEPEADSTEPSSSEAPPELRKDIQAVLTVLGRRDRQHEEPVPDTVDEFPFRLDLSGSDLRRANLGRAHLEKAVLAEAHLEKADLQRAHLEKADLQRAHLEKADLSRASLREANLHQAHLEKANLSQAHLEKADLHEAHLEEAHLYEVHLEDSFLHQSHLVGANLCGAHLERANLRGANLEKADLRGVHLKGANLRQAILTEANLHEVLLNTVTLREAHLIEANLSASRLVGADLRSLHMMGANLRGASLERADLREAHLEQADLQWAHLEQTNLRGVDLSRVLNLTREQLTVAITDDTTILPAYLCDESQAASSGAS